MYQAKLEGRNKVIYAKPEQQKSWQEIALNAFNTPTILIMGGLDRKHSFDELKEYMNNVTNVICYGETKERIKLFCDSINIDCTITENLEEATLKAYSLSKEGYTILLSPACASWDQFDDFEQRGKVFKETVNNIR